MTIAAGVRARHEIDVASQIAQLKLTVAELRRQTDASLAALHTIRARTSKVLAATEAFSALSAEAAALAHRLMLPVAVDRLNEDVREREAFRHELHLLIDQLDGFRQRYASELAATTPRRPPPKKPWWRVFR
jgi:hypothetical protein